MMRVYEKTKPIQFSAYLSKTDYNRLLMLKSEIRRNYNQKISITELIRDGILLLLDEVENESIEKYLQSKGLVD